MTTNEPRVITKKAHEIMSGDYVINDGEVDRVLSVERRWDSDGTTRVRVDGVTHDGHDYRVDWDGDQPVKCVDVCASWPTARLVIVFHAFDRNLEPAVLALRTKSGDYEVIAADPESPVAEGTLLRSGYDRICWHDAVWLPSVHVNGLRAVLDSDHSDLAGRARLINAWDRVNRLVS